jgi:DNA polymerase I
MRGWLLDLNISGRDSVALWIKEKHGRVLQHNIRWMPRIYVAGPPDRLEELERRLAARYEVCPVDKIVRPGSGHVRVLEVATPSHEKAWLARWIHGFGFEIYNVDLPPLQELLYQLDIYPTALLDLTCLKALDNVDDIEYDISVFRTAYLNITTASQELIARFSDRLQSIRLEMDGEVIELDGPEDHILMGLEKALDGIDILLTEDGDGFTIPYIHYRASANGLKIRLGRAGDTIHPPSSRIYQSYGRVHHRFNGSKLIGRVHIDTSNSMLYRETGLEGIIEVARTTRVPLQDAARYTIGNCMSSLQYYQAYRAGILLPWKTGKPTYMTARQLNIADRGGWILDHVPGIYWNVGELDFQSMYPTLMLKNNISGETVNCECCDGVDVPELGYHICDRWRGIVPRAIEIPLQKRLEYKRLYRETGIRIYKRRADALKWILVTSFGYLGFRKAKFGSREAHMTVCALARETLMKSIAIAEEMGFRVIHGIVDCLWISKDGAGDSEYIELAAEIEDRLGLPISYEGRYRWIAFLPSKIHAGRPVNNRYFGVFTDGRLKYRGIELRRTDTPELVKRAQLEMLEKLAEAREPDEFTVKALECYQILNKYLRRLYSGEVDLGELVITNSLSMNIDRYSHQPRHVIAAKRLQYRGVEVRPGQPVSYIISASVGPFRATPLGLAFNYSVEAYAALLKRAFETLINTYTLSGTAQHPSLSTVHR